MFSHHIVDARPVRAARTHLLAANDPMPLADWAKDTPAAKRWAAGKLRRWRNDAGKSIAAVWPTPEVQA